MQCEIDEIFSGFNTNLLEAQLCAHLPILKKNYISHLSTSLHSQDNVSDAREKKLTDMYS